MPTRKNFPSRMTARRKGALERLKKQYDGKLTPPKHAVESIKALERKIKQGGK